MSASRVNQRLEMQSLMEGKHMLQNISSFLQEILDIATDDSGASSDNLKKLPDKIKRSIREVHQVNSLLDQAIKSDSNLGVKRKPPSEQPLEATTILKKHSATIRHPESQTSSTIHTTPTQPNSGYVMGQLYVKGFGRRIKATELSEASASGGWRIGKPKSSEKLALDTVWHESLQKRTLNSPAAAENAIGRDALALARNFSKTFQHATLPESESIGRIVVFSDGLTEGLPSVNACAKALGLKETVRYDDIVYNLRDESTVKEREYSLHESHLGFCYGDEAYDDYEDFGEDCNDRKIKSTTVLMDKLLGDHFEFNMSDEVRCAPVLYGGRSGRAIIAVLSMRTIYT